MKIRSVKVNNKRKMFEVNTASKKYAFPYIKSDPAPSPNNPVTRVFVDKEIGAEGFSYELASGKTGTVHIEHVLEYNSDPGYLRDQLLYKLTLEAQRRVAESPLSNVRSSDDWGLPLLSFIAYWIRRTTANLLINSSRCSRFWIARSICWCEKRVLEKAPF